MNTDDPKFTAHILGELDDITPVERAEIEALIRADATAAAEAAETQELAALLRRELQGEEAQPLTPAQRASILAATAPGPRLEKAKLVPFPHRLTMLSAIAACLIVGISIALIFQAFDAEKSTQGATVMNEPQPGPTITLTPEPVPPAKLPLVVPEVADAAKAELKPADGPPPTDSRNLLAQQLQPLESRMPAHPRAAPPSLPAPAHAAAKQAPAPPTPQAIEGEELKVAATALPGTAPRGQRQPSSPAPSVTVAAGFAMRGAGSKSAGGRASHVIKDNLSFFDADRPDALQDYRRRSEGVSTEKPRDIRAPSAPGITEAFDAITDNAFFTVRENPLSTFSADVDTASYAIVRRFLNEQQLPPKGAVRIEELLNYFTYDYPQPQGDAPFSATMEVATCPWTPAHRLVRIGLKGREIAKDRRPASNLVFLIDVSGSMDEPNKLPLLKQSLGLLIDQLGSEDQVGIVVYAGHSGCVLEPTHNKTKMRHALRNLEAGGSTNGASGIELAYQLAGQSFIKGGTNRVILATDGDWNVGVTNQSDLLDMIAKKAQGGVFLTVLGFGMDNLQDSMLVKLADKGNGHYAYIDTLLEAKKVFVHQLSSTLVTIAKDVKIQVEFNPAQVSGYRLIGYEKRLLAKEDFNDDKKDAGEIGAGHTVTALYEVVPAGKDVPTPARVDALKYQTPAAEKPENRNQKPGISTELLTLKLRYKAPDGDTSKLLEFPLTDAGATWEKSSRDFRFAAAVAGYGMLLRDSPHKGIATWASVHELAVEGRGEDATGYRAEFISLLEKAQTLMR